MKVSIITASYNSEKTINKTILSVLEQTYKDIEYIIIDGASSDKTVDIAKEYEHGIAKIISEPDNGIYDAMNKGIKNATGDYIMFLNSDDQLFDETVIEKLSELAQKNNSDLVWGDICHYNPETGYKNVQEHNKFNIIYLIKNTPAQPACLYKKSLFNEVGLFSTDFKVVSDQEWFLRAFLKHNISRSYINYPINVFNTGGISTNEKYETAISKERKEMFAMYFSPTKFKVYSFIAKYCRSITTMPLIKKVFKI